MDITLEFESCTMRARLFNTTIAQRLATMLPLQVSLQSWGHESYGSIGNDLGSDAPRSEMPPGALAYSSQGNYLCIFYGQQPAWPVEYIGQIRDDQWRQLCGAPPAGVTLRAVNS
jgi:hypothetical protein